MSTEVAQTAVPERRKLALHVYITCMYVLSACVQYIPRAIIICDTEFFVLYVIAILLEVFLTGSRWINELGSVMTIVSKDECGNFSGTYVSSVGEPDPPPAFPLNGRYEVNENALGWAISYGGKFHSTTAWSGQIQRTATGPVIYTTWVLTKSTKPNENWNSTNVGFDTFKLIE